MRADKMFVHLRLFYPPGMTTLELPLPEKMERGKTKTQEMRADTMCADLRLSNPPWQKHLSITLSERSSQALKLG